jgi:dUTP pyrophosphatase
LDRIRIKIKRLPQSMGLGLPSRASQGSSGVDLVACLESPVELPPGEFTLIPTGLCIEIPRGYEAQVRPRSGLALKSGITVLNTPGTIDSDYRGEVGVVLVNLGKEPFTVRRGDRVAQMVFSKVCDPVIEDVESLEDTARGEGGFGHTGVSSNPDGGARE